jgi:hypothetical protein
MRARCAYAHLSLIGNTIAVRLNVERRNKERIDEQTSA